MYIGTIDLEVHFLLLEALLFEQQGQVRQFGKGNGGDLGQRVESDYLLLDTLEVFGTGQSVGVVQVHVVGID